MMDDIINQSAHTLEILHPSRAVQRVRHELKRRSVQVLRVQRLTPHLTAVTFGGSDLADFVTLSFDDHVKLLFDGPDGQPVRRDYTPRHVDHPRRELTIEFALHGRGLASDWARQAAPGQRMDIGGPRGSMIVPMAWDWHLLAGDATALPAIHRRLEELPAGSRAQVLVLMPDTADRLRVATAAQVDMHWADDPDTWLAALRQLPRPAGQGFAWCAGEARLMARARDLLLQQGHPRHALRVSAYWKAGSSDFHETLEG